MLIFHLRLALLFSQNSLEQNEICMDNCRGFEHKPSKQAQPKKKKKKNEKKNFKAARVEHREIAYFIMEVSSRFLNSVFDK
jgi:hypothetical protein